MALSRFSSDEIDEVPFKGPSATSLRTKNFFINEKIFGAVAQLGEHLVCNQGVGGSNPLCSTKI